MFTFFAIFFVVIQNKDSFALCNYENFKNIYDSVYELMLDNVVTESLEEETMFDRDGNIFSSAEIMYGQPARYPMLKSLRHPFVYKTGRNYT